MVNICKLKFNIIELKSSMFSLNMLLDHKFSDRGIREDMSYLHQPQMPHQYRTIKRKFQTK